MSYGAAVSAQTRIHAEIVKDRIEVVSDLVNGSYPIPAIHCVRPQEFLSSILVERKVQLELLLDREPLE